jgi:uncharacterized cupredoxin-like copper-binding protein
MPGSRIRALSIVAVALMALGAAGCGGGGNSISATTSDFKIELGSSSAKSGEVTFKVKNNGPSVHEFVVFKTDLAPDQLPTKQDENGIEIVDEEGQGVEAVDEIEDIKVGASEDLKVNLQPGKYVVICNLPAHYKQGMHEGVTITS